MTTTQNIQGFVSMQILAANRALLIASSDGPLKTSLPLLGHFLLVTLMIPEFLIDLADGQGF